jgi:26S proteasome non-ATPase regulatory subunit 10
VNDVFFLSAAKVGNVEDVKLSLYYSQNISDINVQDEDGNTSLILAVKANKVEIVELLLRSNCDPNMKNKQDGSALMIAISQCSTTMVTTLLASKKTDVNIRGYHGHSPLHGAASNSGIGTTSTVELLIRCHAIIDAVNDAGRTPLMQAASFGNAETLSLLIANHANASLRDSKGMTALDLAKRNQMIPCVEILEQLCQ